MSDWKSTEKEFEAVFEARYGKRAYVFRLTDTAAAKAIAGNRAFVVAQPSDYLLVVEGTVFFAEVKSTWDEKSFHFSNIRKPQIAASRRVVTAGGQYLFFIKSLHHNQWYCVPAQLIHSTIAAGTKHLKWSELESFKYEL